MTLLSEIRFGSYLTYSPHGDSYLAKKSKNIMYALKQEKSIGNPEVPFSEFVITKLKKNLENLPFRDFFSPDTFLVPVPKSSLMQTDELWVPKRLIQQMVEQGLGKENKLLTRVKAVQKSAYAKPSERPKAEDHFESIACTSTLNMPKKVVLVDDVITRGATLLACASKIKKTYPHAEVLAFAVMRTMSQEEDFTSIEDSCVGTIKLISGETHRSP